MVKAVLLGVTVPTPGAPSVPMEDVVWSDELTLDQEGRAVGTLPIGLNVGSTYQFTIVAYDLGRNERGAITWNEGGLYAFSSGVSATIDLASGTNSSSTGGATQGSGTGSSQAKYVNVTFTLMIGGSPATGIQVQGYLASDANGSWVKLSGSTFNGKTDANGQISAQLTTGLDPSARYRYDIAFPISAVAPNSGQSGNVEFYFQYDGSSLASAAGPATQPLSIEYNFSGTTGSTAQITSNDQGVYHDGPAVSSGSPG